MRPLPRTMHMVRPPDLTSKRYSLTARQALCSLHLSSPLRCSKWKNCARITESLTSTCLQICARLPCDKRCEQVLSCGHRCPSGTSTILTVWFASDLPLVCGEDCSNQICPLCADDLRRNDIVDLVMGRTLAELDVDSENLDELVITLPNCRHVFTVETLDGHCGIEEYYRRAGPEGKWLGLEAPPPGIKQPPACPTCRGAITAPRYGRIFKRADLDILENNVAFHMSKSLAAIRSTLDSIPKPQLTTAVKTLANNISTAPLNASTKEFKALYASQTSAIKAARTTPMTLLDIDPLNAKLHKLPGEEAKAWKRVVLKLFNAYKDAAAVSQTRSAHSHAWEASFAHLYQRELDDIIANPMAAPRNPHEYAMRAARLKVGQPPPRADKRFLVEAFWTTINIRLTLVELLLTWLDAVSVTDTEKKKKYPASNRRIWATYTGFLLRSCAADATLALQITRESESHRQEASTVLLTMRIEMEQFRFNMQMMKQNHKMNVENREKMADSANEKLAATHERVSEIRSRRRGKGRENSDWMYADFIVPAEAILEDWKALEMSLRMDTFYQPVSLEELTQVVKGLGFCKYRWSSEITCPATHHLFSSAHIGHFYKCPNGHVFVITEVCLSNLPRMCAYLITR